MAARDDDDDDATVAAVAGLEDGRSRAIVGARLAEAHNHLPPRSVAGAPHRLADTFPCRQHK